MNDNADIDRVLRLAAEFNEALDQFGSYGEEMVCLVAVIACSIISRFDDDDRVRALDMLCAQVKERFVAYDEKQRL